MSSTSHMPNEIFYLLSTRKWPASMLVEDGRKRLSSRLVIEGSCLRTRNKCKLYYHMRAGVKD